MAESRKPGNNSHTEVNRVTPADQAVEFSLDEWNDFGKSSLHQVKYPTTPVSTCGDRRSTVAICRTSSQVTTPSGSQL
jgi:hypothetical protein